MAPEGLLGDAGGVEGVDLKGADSEFQEAVDGFFVIGGHDAYFNNIAEKGECEYWAGLGS